ncbi:MAG: hypothetical protein IH986_09760, partial [Planctomycetes bacterium]|nr:hypothetical protein [Planctomycetota bacterium]
WQTDCYPTGGAFIPRFRVTGVRVWQRPYGTGTMPTGWPFTNYQDNFGRQKYE